MRAAWGFGDSGSSSLSGDRKWPRLIKYTHSRVVGLVLEGNLVLCTLLRRVCFTLLCSVVAQRVGIELAIERSPVRLPVGLCCVTTLGKLFTALRLGYQTVQYGTDVKTGNVTADCVRGVVYRSWEVPWVQSVGPMECHGIGNRYASFIGMVMV